MTHSCFIVAHFLMFLISQFACVKNTAKFEFQNYKLVYTFSQLILKCIYIRFSALHDFMMHWLLYIL